MSFAKEIVRNMDAGLPWPTSAIGLQDFFVRARGVVDQQVGPAKHGVETVDDETDVGCECEGCVGMLAAYKDFEDDNLDDEDYEDDEEY